MSIELVMQEPEIKSLCKILFGHELDLTDFLEYVKNDENSKSFDCYCYNASFLQDASFVCFKECVFDYLMRKLEAQLRLLHIKDESHLITSISPAPGKEWKLITIRDLKWAVIGYTDSKAFPFSVLIYDSLQKAEMAMTSIKAAIWSQNHESTQGSKDLCEYCPIHDSDEAFKKLVDDNYLIPKRLGGESYHGFCKRLAQAVRNIAQEEHPKGGCND